MQHKIVGGLMGFAIGDALGMPLEGLPNHLREFLFPKTINEYMNSLRESYNRKLKKECTRMIPRFFSQPLNS